MGELSTTTTLIVIAAMLLLSAFFSGMEIAFMSKNRLKLEIDRKQSPMFDRLADIFSRNAGQYITTILVGNNIALVVYSLSMSSVIEAMLHNLGWDIGQSILLETTISTIVIILVAEFLPKSIFRSNPNFYYRTLSPVIYLFYLLLYPLARFTTWLSQLLLRLIGRDTSNVDVVTGFDRHDLASLIESGSGPNAEKSTGEGEKERRIFQNALDFADLRVRDSMTPRVDIEAVDIDNTSIEELTDRFVESKYTRLMVWQHSIDNITGYVNSKSLFGSPASLGDIVKRVSFVLRACLSTY